jgi:NAD(P)-dependent dehydrogenase (short-subunit alcohol dehydrogenase family)
MLTKPNRTLVMTGGSDGIGRRAAVDLLRGNRDIHLVILVRGGRGPKLAERACG